MCVELKMADVNLTHMLQLHLHDRLDKHWYSAIMKYLTSPQYRAISPDTTFNPLLRVSVVSTAP